MTRKLCSFSRSTTTMRCGSKSPAWRSAQPLSRSDDLRVRDHNFKYPVPVDLCCSLDHLAAIVDCFGCSLLRPGRRRRGRTQRRRPARDRTGRAGAERHAQARALACRTNERKCWPRSATTFARRSASAAPARRKQAPVWHVEANYHLERKTPYVNHYSFNILDRDWGHVTIKISGHPPFPSPSDPEWP